MKKTVKVLSLITALLLVASLCGCAGNNSVSPLVPGSLDGDSEGMVKIRALYQSIESAQSGATPISSTIPSEGSDLFTLKAFYPKGDGASDDSLALNNAIKAASALTHAYLVISMPIMVAESIFVPANVTLCFEGTGKIVTGNDSTVMFESGSKIIAGMNQIFFGNGAIKGIAVNGKLDFDVRPEWFGVIANNNADEAGAFQKAIDAAGTVWLASGIYDLVTSLTLPADRDFAIKGPGVKAAQIISYVTSGSLFVANSTGEITFEGFQTDLIGHAATTDFIVFNGNGTGKLRSSYLYVYGYNKAFNLSNMGAFSSTDGFSSANNCYFYLNSCKNVNIERNLGNGNFHYFYGTGLENVSFLNAAAVWDYGTNVEIVNSKDILFRNCGFDLGYTYVSGAARPYGENENALLFISCHGVSITSSWIATNGGISYTTTATVAKPSDRIGIMFSDCYDSVVKYCTITNHSYGMKIANSPSSIPEGASAVIVVEGNDFCGNEDNEMVFVSARYIQIKYNTFLQHTGEISKLTNVTEFIANNSSDILVRGNTIKTLANDTEVAKALGNINIVCESNIYV